MNKDLEKDYLESLKFWDKTLVNSEEYKIEPWIEDEKFLSIINDNVKENSSILDYATGSGWAVFEIASRKSFHKAIAIDASKNAIESNIRVAKFNKFNNIQFIAGCEDILNEYKDTFDFAISINLFDVIPDEVVTSVLDGIYQSMKKDGVFFIGLNPDFTEEELTSLIKMEKSGHYFYKDGILRCNKHSIEEWIETFSKKFNVLETFKFTVIEQEKKYPRVGFILKK